jgi:hypothetical protein
MAAERASSTLSIEATRISSAATVAVVTASIHNLRFGRGGEWAPYHDEVVEAISRRGRRFGRASSPGR